MQDLSEWSRLDAAAFRVSIHRSVRWFAWWGAIIGTVVTVLGIAAPFVPLVAIGLVLAGAGIWNLCRPSVTGLLVDGVVMILTGIFNGLAWLWVEEARSSSAARWIFAGLFQVFWGYKRLALYAIARRTRNDPQAIARLEALVRELTKRKAKDDPLVVEFRTGRFRHQRNRIGLYAEGSVALLEHQAVRLEKRSDIWIEARGTTLGDRSVKVRIQMSDLELTGQMATVHFERFERWKLGLTQSRPLAA